MCSSLASRLTLSLGLGLTLALATLPALPLAPAAAPHATAAEPPKPPTPKPPAPNKSTTGKAKPEAPAKDPVTWGELSDEQREQVVKELKTKSAGIQQRMGLKLREAETKYFLFYTDIDDADARKWSRHLDEMYDIFCDNFAIKRGTNIWHGKAVVWVFKNRADYLRFGPAYVGLQIPEWSAGVCFPNREVMIAFFRAPTEATFANVLVHETAHGFNHRYRAEARYPSWVEEGLAEYFAKRIVKNNTDVDSKERAALVRLKKSPVIGQPFFDEKIGPGDYGVASGLIRYMIEADGKRFLRFANAIKDGSNWRDSLAQSYKATPEQLIAAYGKSIGVRNLKPW